MSRRSSRVVPQKDLPRRIKTLFHAPDPVVNKKLELIHTDPNIFLVRNFLSETELRHIDRFCTNRCAIFKNSFTEDDDNNEVISEERTSMYTYLNKGQDNVIRNIEARASELCGMGQEHCEPLQIVSYTQGQKFETHHDAGTLCDDGTVELVPPRRLATLFLYLNNLPEEQGHTQFPDLGISVRPERGCGVLFCNVLSNGDVDPRTVHRAQPVQGRLKKYGVNVWLCDQSFQDLALVPRGKREKGADGGAFDASKKSALQEAEQLAAVHGTNSYIDSDSALLAAPASQSKVKSETAKPAAAAAAAAAAATMKASALRGYQGKAAAAAAPDQAQAKSADKATGANRSRSGLKKRQSKSSAAKPTKSVLVKPVKAAKAAKNAKPVKSTKSAKPAKPIHAAKNANPAKPVKKSAKVAKAASGKSRKKAEK